jgi:hypothetical protein
MDNFIARPYPAGFCIFNYQRMAKFDVVVSLLQTLSPRILGGWMIATVARILNSLNLFNAPIFVAVEFDHESKI